MVPLEIFPSWLTQNPVAWYIGRASKEMVPRSCSYRDRGTEGMNFGTGVILSPLPPSNISGVSNQRSTAMKTAIGHPEGSPSGAMPSLKPHRVKLTSHDQAECDYLDAIWALDSVEGSDNE